MNTVFDLSLLASVFCALLVPAPQAYGASKPAPNCDYFTYFGGYSKGIYVSRFDSATGKLGAPELAVATRNPSFLALHPNGQFLYAVGEMEKGGSVSAFAIDKATGKLTLLNTRGARGKGPCHVAVDHAGKNVAIANYGSGSIAVYPVAPDGRLKEASAFVQHTGSSVDPKRQKGPHAHEVIFSPDNRFLLVADLGLDKVLVYRFAAEKGTVEPNTPAFAKVAPGAGPRHLAFGRDGHTVYVINEMNSTVTVFSYDAAKGVLRELQTISTLPKGFKGTNYPAEIEVEPSGKYVYGSNRGHDSIAVFSIDANKGTLTAVEQVSSQGSWPRGFKIDPTGKWLVNTNEKGNNIVVYHIDPATGRLKPTGQVLPLEAPACVVFLPFD